MCLYIGSYAKDLPLQGMAAGPNTTRTSYLGKDRAKVSDPGLYLSGVLIGFMANRIPSGLSNDR